MIVNNSFKRSLSNSFNRLNVSHPQIERVQKSVSLDTIFSETSTIDKENMQIDYNIKFSKDTNSSRRQHIKKDPFKEILDSHLNSFTYQHSNYSIDAEQLLKVLQIVESFNRFMLLYKCVEPAELDFEKFTKSLLSNKKSNENEIEYFLNTIRTLIIILLNEEMFSKCLLFNNKLSSSLMLNDSDYLSETASIVVKMIDEIQSESTDSNPLLKEKCYLLKNEKYIFCFTYNNFIKFKMV